MHSMKNESYVNLMFIFFCVINMRIIIYVLVNTQLSKMKALWTQSTLSGESKLPASYLSIFPRPEVLTHCAPLTIEKNLQAASTNIPAPLYPELPLPGGLTTNTHITGVGTELSLKPH